MLSFNLVILFHHRGFNYLPAHCSLQLNGLNIPDLPRLEQAVLNPLQHCPYNGGSLLSFEKG